MSRKVRVIVAFAFGFLLFSMWIYFSGIALASFKYDYFCFDKFIETYKRMPSTESELLTLSDCSLDALEINYGQDISIVEVKDNKLVGKNGKSIWIVRPKRKLIFNVLYKSIEEHYTMKTYLTIMGKSEDDTVGNELIYK